MTDKPTDESKVELARAIVAKYGDDPIDDEFNSSGITEIEARLLEAFGPLEMARIITAAMHQASDTGDDDALVREAFQEALKRYPDAHGALTFFWTAAGFAAVPPTSEQMTWAKGCADRLQAKAHEGGTDPMVDVALAAHERCNRCGREYRMWSAPSPLWNAVMRGGCINGPWEYGEMICANCFMEMAEDRGIANTFRVSADNVKVPLQTVTPSGRTWDDKRGLWIEQRRKRTVVSLSHKRRTIEVRKP